MNYVVFALRVATAAIFIVAGASKIGHFNYFATQIAGFQILPHGLIAPLALLLPFFEIIVGAYLLIGLFTTVAAWIAAIQLWIFSAAIASTVVRGIVTSCGCFGPNDTTKTSWAEVLRDVVIGCVIAFVAWRAPGAFALDGRMGAMYEQSSATSG